MRSDVVRCLGRGAPGAGAHRACRSRSCAAGDPRGRPVGLPAPAPRAGREARRRVPALLRRVLVLRGPARRRPCTRSTARRSRRTSATWTSRRALNSLSGTDFMRVLDRRRLRAHRSVEAGRLRLLLVARVLGLFLFYRAFTIAVPQGRRRSYAYCSSSCRRSSSGRRASARKRG